jgi:cell division protein FtsB
VASSGPRPSPKSSRGRKPVAPSLPGANRTIVRWLLVFAASLIIVDGLFGERGLLAMLRARNEYRELSTAIDRQRADNARFREEARRLREDPTAIEEIARRELGLIKPGEKVFIVRDVPPAKP